MKKRLGILNMQWHVTWKMALFVMLVIGSVQLFHFVQMLEGMESILQLEEESKIYFEKILYDLEWYRYYWTGMVLILLVLGFVPLWQGRGNGFYTQLRLPMAYQEYAILQWLHSIIWIFLYWVVYYIILQVTFIWYTQWIGEPWRGTDSLVWALIRNNHAVKLYPVATVKNSILWIVQMAMLAVVPVYQATCVQTGHKWGIFLIGIVITGTVMAWLWYSTVGILLWMFFSAFVLWWMLYLMKCYMTVEKGL